LQTSTPSTEYLPTGVQLEPGFGNKESSHPMVSEASPGLAIPKSTVGIVEMDDSLLLACRPAGSEMDVSKNIQNTFTNVVEEIDDDFALS